MTSLKIARLTMIAFIAFTAVGCSCAKKDELDAVRIEASRANTKAEQALETAREANQRSADAVARAQQAEEAVSRGFKKSMRK